MFQVTALWAEGNIWCWRFSAPPANSFVEQSSTIYWQHDGSKVLADEILKVTTKDYRRSICYFIWGGGGTETKY